MVAAFLDAAAPTDDTKALEHVLLFLLLLLPREDIYTSKVGPTSCVENWLHFLLVEYDPTRRLVTSGSTFTLVQPDCGVRRRVTSAGTVELAPVNWPESSRVPEVEQHEYDVCISFASEQRDFARRLAKALKSHKLRVFFDEDERSRLWGKDLFNYLYRIYSTASQFCVILFSKEYLARAWTIHELRAAQRRTLLERSEYVLPIVFGDTAVPEEYQNIMYLRSADANVKGVADLITERMLAHLNEHYLTAEEMAEAINVDIVSDVLQGAIADELRKLAKRKSSRCLGAAVVGSLFAFPYHRVIPSVQGLMRYLLFAFEPVDNLFKGSQFSFGSRIARVFRGKAPESVLFLPLDWADQVKPAIRRRMPSDSDADDSDGTD